MNNRSYMRTVMMVMVMALAVGIIYAYPDLWFMNRAGAGYKGIAPIGFWDETLYLGRLNAVYKGDVALRNPAIYEHRNDPVIMPPLSELIEANLGRLFKLSVAGTDMAATFVLPALLFLLIALFAYTLSRSLCASLAAALAVLFGMHLFSRLFLLGGKIVNSAYDLPLWFARPVTPQMHFIFFVAALTFIYKTLAGHKAVYTVLGGLFLGSLFYVSVFYWVYIYAVIGVVCLIALVDKDIAAFRDMALAGIIAAVVALPYWIGNAATMANPNYNLLLYRFNIGYTHRPIVPTAAIVGFAAVVAARKAIIAAGGKKAFYFLSSMMAAVMLTLNQQVLTGKLFKQSHWTTYTGKFVIVVAVVISAWLILERISRAGKGARIFARSASAMFFIALFLHAAGVQAHYNHKHFDENLKMQKMAGLFRWLKANTGRDDVLLPSPNDTRLSELIPVYTDNFVYYSEPFFCLSLVSADEARSRMMAGYRIFGYSEADAERHPYSWDGAIFLTSDTNREPSFIERERSALKEGYRKVLGEDGIEFAGRYKLDYIVAAKARDSESIARLAGRGLRKVYEDGDYVVLKAGGSHG